MTSAKHGIRVAFSVSAILLLLTLQSSWTDWFRSAPAPAPAQAQAPAPDKPRYIFVDLGANGADSLEAFLEEPKAKFHYDYPSPTWATHRDAEIFLFEANPFFNEKLVKAKERYTAQGIKVNIFPSTVVDVEDGIRTFYLDTVNKENDYWGSSIYSEHRDVKASGAIGTRLTGINLATWLQREFLPRDFVVIKMDIEGAEYELVPHLADMSAWTVIDHLLVEFHGSEIAGGTPEEIERRELRAKAASKKLVDEGVNMPYYFTLRHRTSRTEYRTLGHLTLSASRNSRLTRDWSNLNSQKSDDQRIGASTAFGVDSVEDEDDGDEDDDDDSDGLEDGCCCNFAATVVADSFIELNIGLLGGSFDEERELLVLQQSIPSPVIPLESRRLNRLSRVIFRRQSQKKSSVSSPLCWQ
ncbi:hypothetical protein BGZ83_001191 [Gryganskiella cystojenkinii]|nr:hypothetical protein BGZ83_001191 [Gryganskiella cystojenkinii]